MVALLPPAELQFSDANGKPYAGGKLATYVAGTTTPKSTWQDPDGTTLNTNPIVLDSAGRCIIYADGIVRTILTDAAGNLVWDQLSNTLVSVAMAPVCIAPDIPTAQGLLGIVDNSATLAALSAAISAETTNRTAADTAEATARAAADTTNANAITAETTRAEAAEAALAAGNGFPANTRLQMGTGITDGSGNATVTFATPFGGTPIVVASENSGPSFAGIVAYAATINGFLVFSSKSFTTGQGLGPAGFSWIALGPT